MAIRRLPKFISNWSIFSRRLKGHSEKQMSKALLVFVEKARQNTFRFQPTVRRSGKVRGLDPARPGEFPKIASGVYRASLAGQVVSNGNTITGYVGILKNSPATAYALRLEEGFIGRDSMYRLYHDLPRHVLKRSIQDPEARARFMAELSS